jgi:alkylated DNA repair dioxygenase AlkB
MSTKINNGEYIYQIDYFNKIVAENLMSDLENSITWSQEKLMMFGKEINFPRLMAFYGDQNISYSFSRNTYNALPWTDSLLKIKSKLESDFKIPFNSVLLNMYRSGKDSMDWHQDNEKELGKNPIIASVNFGASRKFELRNIDSREKINFELGHGSLLLMKGKTQHYWQHRVPKTKKEVSVRINLTFRRINT